MTKRILNRMLLLINQGKVDSISLKRLADNLEGSLNALEEPLSAEFIEEWFLYWGELELILALGETPQPKKKIFAQLENLERIVQREVDLN